MSEAWADIRKLLSQSRLDRFVSEGAWQHIARAFPGEEFEDWVTALGSLTAAGIGPGGAAAYVRASPLCADIVGADATLALAASAAQVMRRAHVRAAINLLSAAPLAARRLKHTAGFLQWLHAIEDLAGRAPESVDLVIDRSDQILSQLDAEGFRAWTLAGIRNAGDSAERRVSFFSLSEPDALRVFEQESGLISLGEMERLLKAYLAALWGIYPIVRPLPPRKSLMFRPRRATFDRFLIRFPETYPGFTAQESRRLFLAGIAHVGAHIMFTPERFPVGPLKPVQVALVSLIEDARVETLAAQEFPGLGRLWRSFHVAQPNTPLVAEAHMARLARALIDPAYEDDDPWVNKGKMMFFDARSSWDDARISRTIGGLLGNDLGQMRVQFNTKSYVVEPPYRDDNMGVWDFGEPPETQADDADVIYDSFHIEHTEEDKPHHRQRTEEHQDAAHQAARVRAVEEDIGMPVARYPEWDHLLGRERPDWTQVVEFEPRPANSDPIELLIAEYPDVVARITKLIRSAKVSQPTRMKRQPEGDRLDLEACIRATIDRRAGRPFEHRVYETTALRYRDLSVLLLLDISESTRDQVRGTDVSVLSLERAATVLLSVAMSGLGDPFAIHAFCSNGRNEVRCVRVKDFQALFDDKTKTRLAGLRSGYSTRIGAALRHAGAELEGQLTHRRLLLVVTDGEPSDIDIKDKRYLVEDARKAVQGLAHRGIDVFCVGLDGGGESYLTRIFGRHNVLLIDRVTALPEKLPMLYLRLTA
jgi:hypothetical protein